MDRGTTSPIAYVYSLGLGWLGWLGWDGGEPTTEIYKALGSFPTQLDFDPTSPVLLTSLLLYESPPLKVQFGKMCAWE